MSFVRWSLKRAALLAAFALAAAVPAAAQGWIDPIPGRIAPDWGVVKLRTEVHVRVLDRVAEIEVEEWFENRGGGLGEGDYVYPLPGEAVFSNFSLYQGDEELRGETMDADRARAIYEEIVRQQRDPALIELIGHGMVRARVFPFQPGETRRITMRYTQVLDRAGDALLFRYAAGSATGGNIVRPEPMPRPMNDVRPGIRRGPSNVPLTFELTAEDGTRFRDPFSPTHELEVRRTGGRLSVRPESSLAATSTLFLPLARGLVGMSLVIAPPEPGEDGYFMLTLSPGQARAEDATPRDIVAVVDVSRLDVRREDASRRRTRSGSCCRRSAPRDRFHLVAFSNRVTTYRTDWTQANAAELGEARRWVDGLVRVGRHQHLGRARGSVPPRLAGQSSAHRRLHDRRPAHRSSETNPESASRRARSATAARARVFAFGVGFDVNTYLLDRLSDAGRGATEYVTPDQDVEEAVARLAAKVQHPC